MGLYIQGEGRDINVLQHAEVLPCNFRGVVSDRVKTSRCNRYDVIQGGWNIFVIDKLEEKLSVAKMRFRVDDTTFCEETPIVGNSVVGVYDADSRLICPVSFPFLAFDTFWKSWEGYVKYRKQQIKELQNTEQGVAPNR